MQGSPSSLNMRVYDLATPWQHLIDGFDLLETALISLLLDYNEDYENLTTRNRNVSWWCQILKGYTATLHQINSDNLYNMSCRIFCIHSSHVRERLQNGDAYQNQLERDLTFYEYLLSD